MLRHPRFDRFLVGSPLRRPRAALAIIAVLLLTLSFALFMLVGTLSRFRADVLAIFILGLGAASLCSVVPLAVLWVLDRRERESLWLYTVAFLWGALIATGVALPFNSAILYAIAEWVEANPAVQEFLGAEAAMLIGAPIAGPLVEEVTKGLGVVALFILLRAEFDNMRDGFIYGALVGVGFTWVEAPLYVAQNYAQFGFAPWGLQFGARYSLFGLAGHAMFTGLFGAFLGLARQTNRRWVRYTAPLLGLLLAIAAHAVNNVIGLLVVAGSSAAGEAPPQAPVVAPDIGVIQAWTQSSVANLILFFPFLVIMLVLLWRSGLWERHVIREELAEEVGYAVSPGEYAQIERDGMFQTRRIDRLHRKRSAALVNAQNELAFRKRRVRDRGADPASDTLVAGWRNEIGRLRGIA